MTPNEEIRTVLKEIRRITRALDIHSRYLNRESGLTLPQLIVLRCVRDLGEPPAAPFQRGGPLAPNRSGILDQAYRQGADRAYPPCQQPAYRHFTFDGKRGLPCWSRYPSPLGEGFSLRFFSLPDEERAQIITSLAKVASFTKGENLDEIGSNGQYDHIQMNILGPRRKVFKLALFVQNIRCTIC